MSNVKYTGDFYRHEVKTEYLASLSQTYVQKQVRLLFYRTQPVEGGVLSKGCM